VTWSYSTNEERYEGDFETEADAVAFALTLVSDGEEFWVGEDSEPVQPEDWWEAADWLEHVSSQDEYSMDCADSWDRSTKEQREELEAAVRNVMAEWLDRHRLRPTFWVVKDPVSYRRIDGKAMRTAQKAGS